MDVDHPYECIPARLHHESMYIAIVSHGTQDVSICNVIVSEAS